MLRGIVPCSEVFLNKFYSAFKEELDTAKAQRALKELNNKRDVNFSKSESLKSIASCLSKIGEILNKLAGD